MPQAIKVNDIVYERRNRICFREIRGIKQDALALELGDDWNQQKIPLLEQKETIDAPLLQQISAALKIPVEAIQDFDEEQAMNVIANTFNDAAYFAGHSATFNINPIEELRKLHDEKMALYERMLREKDEMMGRFESLIEGK